MTNKETKKSKRMEKHSFMSSNKEIFSIFVNSVQTPFKSFRERMWLSRSDGDFPLGLGEMITLPAEGGHGWSK